MELAKSAPEAGIHDDAAPALTDEGGTDKARGLVPPGGGSRRISSTSSSISSGGRRGNGGGAAMLDDRCSPQIGALGQAIPC